MSKITLVCTSLNPDKDLLNRMLNSATMFDEIVLNIDQQPFEYRNDFHCRYKQIARVFNKDHWSIPNAYNWMIEKSKTEWVCCFCDDDYFFSEGLSRMIAEVHNGIDADVAHFKFMVSGYMPKNDVRGRIHRGLTGRNEYILWEKHPITPKLLKRHGRMPAASFFRKSAWDKVGGFKGDKFHDWDLWRRMAEAGCTFKYFDHLVYNYVRRDGSAWVKQNKIK